MLSGRITPSNRQQSRLSITKSANQITLIGLPKTLKYYKKAKKEREKNSSPPREKMTTNLTQI